MKQSVRLFLVLAAIFVAGSQFARGQNVVFTPSGAGAKLSIAANTNAGFQATVQLGGGQPNNYPVNPYYAVHLDPAVACTISLTFNNYPVPVQRIPIDQTQFPGLYAWSGTYNDGGALRVITILILDNVGAIDSHTK